MRLNDNVWVNGVCYPTGCCPPALIAALIGDHAWEAGDPTVAAPTPDVDAQTPATTDAPSPAASVVDPATLDGSLMGQLDEVPDDAATPDGDAQAVVGSDDAEPDGDHRDPCVDGSYCGGPHCPPADDPESSDAVDAPAPPALPDPLPSEPPRAGRGASRAAWADHAAALLLNTTEDMKLADIIAAVDAHLAQFGPDGRG